MREPLATLILNEVRGRKRKYLRIASLKEAINPKCKEALGLYLRSVKVEPFTEDQNVMYSQSVQTIMDRGLDENEAVNFINKHLLKKKVKILDEGYQRNPIDIIVTKIKRVLERREIEAKVYPVFDNIVIGDPEGEHVITIYAPKGITARGLVKLRVIGGKIEIDFSNSMSLGKIEQKKMVKEIEKIANDYPELELEVEVD